MQLLKKAYAVTGVALASALLFKSKLALAASDKFDDTGLIIPDDGDLNSPNDARTIFRNLANSALDIVLLIIGILAVFYLIYSGYLYITSAGNPDNVKKARQGIINAVIGIVIILAAFFIVRFATGIGRTVVESEEG